MVSLEAYFPYFSYFLPPTTLKLQLLCIRKIRKIVEFLIALGASETKGDDKETDIQT